MKRHLLKIFLLSLILLEIAMITWYRLGLGYYASPLVFFLSSISICILPVFAYHWGYILKTDATSYETNKIENTILLILAATVLVYFSLDLKALFEAAPINIKYSDIIPTVDILSARLLEGSYVYAPITDFKYPLSPSYLTMHWLPFTASNILHFDHRWTSTGIFFAVTLYFSYDVVKNKGNVVMKCIPIGLILLYAIALFYHLETLYSLTIETLIFAYYLILSVGLKRNNTILIGIGILFCLLSRFALVLWIPLALYVLYKENKKQAKTIFWMVTGGVLILYVIPFLLKDPSTLKNHFGKAIDEWHVKWFSVDNKPTALYSGTGFASYFYRILPYDVPVKAKIAQYFHILASIFAVVSCYIYYIKSRHNPMANTLFLLLSLKFCLTFFYNFIHVPYPYLNATPVFVSFVIYGSIYWRKPNYTPV